MAKAGTEEQVKPDEQKRLETLEKYGVLLLAALPCKLNKRITDLILKRHPRACWKDFGIREKRPLRKVADHLQVAVNVGDMVKLQKALRAGSGSPDSFMDASLQQVRLISDSLKAIIGLRIR